MPFCVAFACNNKSKEEGLICKEGVTFHKFPKDPEKKQAWIKAVGRKNWNPSASSYLCSEHFEERFIDRTSSNCVKLRDDAVPTIFKGHPHHIIKKKKQKSPSSENESDYQQNYDDIGNQGNFNEVGNLDENGEQMNENEDDENTTISENECAEYTEEMLICMIKGNPVLYDKTVPDYWKKIKQNQTWKALAERLKIPVKECQQQWDALLLKYSNQRSVINKFKAKGHKAKSTWPLYEVMNFMDKHLDTHLVELKKVHKMRTVEVKNGQKEPSETCYTEDNLNFEDNSGMLCEGDNGYTDNENLSTLHSEEPQPGKEEVVNTMTQSPLIRLSDNVSATKRVITDVNEDVQFVNSLLPVLVRMKRKKKAQCKAEVMNVLANYESEDEP